MSIELFRDRVFAIRAAEHLPATSLKGLYLMPLETMQARWVITTGLRSKPLSELLIDPAVLEAADVFGQWLEHIQTTTPQRRNN